MGVYPAVVRSIELGTTNFLSTGYHNVYFKYSRLVNILTACLIGFVRKSEQRVFLTMHI
jgi:hypothetical protein